MKYHMCIFCFCMFCFIQNSESWTNYRIFMRALKMDYVNANYLILHKFGIQAYNRTYTNAVFNGTVIKTIEDYRAELRLFKYMTNRYEEQLRPIELNLCHLLVGQDNDGQTGLTASFWSAMAKPIRDFVLAPGNKFPRSCPFTPQDLFVKLHFDEEKMPKFLLPAGKYRLWVKILDGSVKVAIGILDLEIVEYSSEKQKKRLG